MTYPEAFLRAKATKANLKSLKNSLIDEARRVGKGNKPVTRFVFELLDCERLRLAGELNRIPIENRKCDEVLQIQQQLSELTNVLGVRLIQKSWC